MTTCPFCGSALRHSWPPALWFECGTKVGTKKPNRDHQTLGCLKGENENLSAALDRIRSKISSLKEQVKR